MCTPSTQCGFRTSRPSCPQLKGWETDKKLVDLEASVQALNEDKAALASRAALLESQLQHAQAAAAASQKQQAATQQHLQPAVQHLQPAAHHHQHSAQLTPQPSLRHHPPPASGVRYKWPPAVVMPSTPAKLTLPV